VLAGLVLLYLLLAALSFMPQPHTGGDNAAYISLGRSLLEQQTYQDLYDPAEPPHTRYPPVFPLLLAAGMAVGLKPWVGLKLVGIVLGGCAIAATFLWLRRRGRPGLALGVALLLAISPGVLTEVHWILSDVPFWCFTALALWAFERLRSGDWRRFGLAALFAVLAYFTRSAGLPLMVAAAGWLAWRRHWRQLAALALVLGPLVFLWWLRARSAGGGVYVSYFMLVDPYDPSLGRADLAGLLARVPENLVRYATMHLPVLFRGTPTLPAQAAGIALLMLALFGWACRLRRARVAELFLPLYAGVVLIWPVVWSSERFVLPIFGLLLAYAGDGVMRAFGGGRTAVPSGGKVAAEAGGGAVIRARGSTWRGRSAAVVAAAALVLLAVPGLLANVRAGTACTGAWQRGEGYPCLGAPWLDYFGMAEWVGQALPQDAVVLSRKPTLFYVIGGRQGRYYPLANTTEALLASADSAGARWVVLDDLGGLAQRYLAPAILQRPQAFCIAQATPSGGAVLFGILPGAASMPDAPPGTKPSFAGCAWPLGEIPALAPPEPVDSAATAEAP
jgi:hypothetical protein